MKVPSRRAIRREVPTATSTVVLTLLAVLGWSPPAAGQMAEAPAHRRDPVVATAIAAVVPGGGHYYAGERGRAAFVATTVAAGGAVVWSAWQAEDRCVAPECERSGARRRGNIGIGMVAGAYLFGLVDAPRAAGRQNRARSLAGRSPSALLVIAPDGAAGVSVRIPLTR